MGKHEQLQIFQSRNVRSVWDDEQEQWYFSVVDICHILTDQPDYDHARNYWKVLKHRLKKEGNETVTKCNQLKLVATDGKRRLTDVATPEQLFRIIQSIPSPKAEPFKLWMAKVAAQRLDQMQDPELDIQQAIEDYKRLGYDDKWINQRMKTIEIRKGLTLNGKKKRIKDTDFEKAFVTCGILPGIFENIKKKYLRLLPKFLVAIDDSFLNAEQKDNYKQLLAERLGR